MGEGAGLALELLHPVSRHARPVALGVSERARPDVGDPHVGLAAVAMERPQHRVVRRLAADEPLGRVDVPRALDPHDPITRPRQEDHLARQLVVTAPNVLDLDLPAQISRADHWSLRSSVQFSVVSFQ